MHTFPSFGENFFWDTTKETNFPFYNVGVMEKNEDQFFIEMALAGYYADDIKVTLDRGILTIEGDTPEDNRGVSYVTKGIKTAKFRRRFRLADHVYVDSVQFVDGILFIKLERKVPEEEKPKVFEITHRGNPLGIGKSES